jgi:3-phosphoshikimate 1-carboxyvinyltransferase
MAGDDGTGQFEPNVDRALRRLQTSIEAGESLGPRAAVNNSNQRLSAHRKNAKVPKQNFKAINWASPPSKSHMIRWLALSAQAVGKTELHFLGTPGGDIESMARCLEQLDVTIIRNDTYWTVHGNGPNALKRPKSVLNVDNSGTALRLLTAISSRFDAPVMLDGDATIRRRPSEPLRNVLRTLGCELSSGERGEALPLLLLGITDKEAFDRTKNSPIPLDISSSSQPLSALINAAPGFPSTLYLQLNGAIVSSEHASLSLRIARQTGSKNSSENSSGLQKIEPWMPECPTRIDIPNDQSIDAFGTLLGQLHEVPVKFRNTAPEESLGADILAKIGTTNNFDLTNASDIICPLAALLAIGEGGEISGAGHARFKESNRIERTAEMLAAFCLDAEITADGLTVLGGQSAVAPNGIVHTHGDHRLHMTAACLATKVGAELSDFGIHEITYPEFNKVVLIVG